MYQEVRDMREANKADADLDCIIQTLITDYPDDWLLTLEILEFAKKTKDEEIMAMAAAYLEEIKKAYPEYSHLVENGIGL